MYLGKRTCLVILKDMYAVRSFDGKSPLYRYGATTELWHTHLLFFSWCASLMYCRIHYQENLIQWSLLTEFEKNETLSSILVYLLVMSDHGRWSFLHIAAFNNHWYALFSTVTFLMQKRTHDMTAASKFPLQ